MLNKSFSKTFQVRTHSPISMSVLMLNKMFQLYDGEKWNIIQNFKNDLSQKVDIYKHYKTKSFFRVYAWFVLPSFRGQGIYIKNFQIVLEAIHI